MLRIINPMYSWKIQTVTVWVCVWLQMEFGEWCMISKLDFHFLPLGIFSHLFLFCLFVELAYGVWCVGQSIQEDKLLSSFFFHWTFESFLLFSHFIYLYFRMLFRLRGVYFIRCRSSFCARLFRTLNRLMKFYILLRMNTEHIIQNQKYKSSHW